MRLPSHSARQHSTGPALRAPFSFSALLAVIAVFLTQLGQGAFWSMEENYGSNAGFNSHAIGMILSASTLLLLLGAVGAACAGNRFGRYNSLLIVIALNAFSILLVSTIAIQWVYLAANLLQSVTNLSAVIYQLGLAACMDRGGRVVAVSTALVTLGNGIGPGLAASLYGVFGAPFIGVFVLGLNALALGLYCMVVLRGAEETKLSASIT
jgi:MFS family permease